MTQRVDDRVMDGSNFGPQPDGDGDCARDEGWVAQRGEVHHPYAVWICLQAFPGELDRQARLA